MKILLRIILGIVGLVAVVAACGLAYLFLSYPRVPPAGDVRITATPEALARGEYLVDHVSICFDCHSERDWDKFAGPLKPGTLGKGGEAFDKTVDPQFPGAVYAKNITPAGIGSWTDGEVLRAVVEGVSRDGTPLFPLMPYPRYGQMSEDDVHAMIAYVRTLKPIENAVPDRSLDFPMNLIVRTIPGPAVFKPRPPASDKIVYGEYMTNAALCSECHTPMDSQGQPLPGKTFAGGNTFKHPNYGFRVVTANITPDADTGIGSWTEQQFIDKFKGFETPNDQTLSDAEQRQNTAMPWTRYAGMTREDLAAIYAYLRTLQPVVNRINKHPDDNSGGLGR
ncbi:MAG: c-type cytochrome [Vicinamibacterales bacterium]